MKKGLRRVAVAAVATLVVAPALATVASATPTFAFTRIAGADRNATAVQVAAKYGTSANVILANGTKTHTVDALTAAYLAGFAKAPVLLTGLNSTPDNVKAQIVASGAKDIWVIGGVGAISLAQETALGSLGTVHRLGGDDRYLTAQKVIGQVGAAKSTTAIVTTGINFPDALGAGPLSYVKGMPIGITLTNTLPDSTLAALKAAGVTSAIVLGGPTVVAPSVVAALTAGGITPFVGAGVTAGRIYGQDRAETSAMLADYMIAHQDFTNMAVNVASGQPSLDGADALGGAALSGKDNRPTLITDSSTVVGAGILPFLTAHANTLASGYIFGGPGAISAAAQTAMETAARTATSNQTYSVSPSTSAVVPFGAPSASTTRTYTATVPTGTLVDIALFEASNVTVAASGAATFADTDSNNVADIGTLGGATISSVNGVANASATFNNVTSTGTITFSVTSTATASVLPVVFDKADSNNTVDLVVPTTANALPKAPTDAVGVGGAITFVPAQAGLGSSTPTIATVDTTLNYFTSSAATYNWDANDTFQFGGVGVTQAQFESVLNPSDVLAVAYNPSAAGVSVFNVTTDKVLVPGTPTAVASNINGGTTANDVKVTFAPDADAASGDTYTLYGSLNGGTYAMVTGTTQAAGTTAGTITFTKLDVATGNWTYGVHASSALGTVEVSSAASASIAVPAVADTTKPLSSTAVLTTNAGLAATADAGDVWTITYNEAMKAPVAGAIIQVKDSDTTVANFVNGTNATFSLDATAKILTVTVTSQPAAAQTLVTGSPIGVQYAVVVQDSSGITDLAGNSWNLGGGSDVTIP